MNKSVRRYEVKKENIRRAKVREALRIVRNTFVVLTLIALVTLVMFSLWFSAFRVYRDGMAPVAEKGDIVISIKQSVYKRGEVIAFYHNNNIFIKRIAAVGGDEVIIDEDGRVYINGIETEDEHAVNPEHGDSDTTYPYEVPEGKFFVLGDNREESEDSRMKKVGSVSTSLIIGRVFVRIRSQSGIVIVK